MRLARLGRYRNQRPIISSAADLIYYVPTLKRQPLAWADQLTNPFLPLTRADAALFSLSTRAANRPSFGMVRFCLSQWVSGEPWTDKCSAIALHKPTINRSSDRAIGGPLPHHRTAQIRWTGHKSSRRADGSFRTSDRRPPLTSDDPRTPRLTPNEPKPTAHIDRRCIAARGCD